MHALQAKLIFLYSHGLQATNIFKSAEYQPWDGEAQQRDDNLPVPTL